MGSHRLQPEEFARLSSHLRDVSVEDALPMLKAACELGDSELIDKATQPRCEAAERVMCEVQVVPVVALHFDRLSVRIVSEDFAPIPDHDTLCKLLSRVTGCGVRCCVMMDWLQDTLSVQKEDYVFDMIREYVAKAGGQLNEAQHIAIWRCCRHLLLLKGCPSESSWVQVRSTVPWEDSRGTVASRDRTVRSERI